MSDQQPVTPAKRGRGRPSKFTPEVRDKILTALRAGNYRNVACQYAGINIQTLHNWIAKAEHPDAPPEYLEFVEALQKAEADAEVADLALIRRSAQDGQWQAAAWIRERKNPERWGRRDRQTVELTGADGGPVQMQVAGVVEVSAIEGLLGALERRRRELGEPVVDVEPLD
jgi:transposase